MYILQNKIGKFDNKIDLTNAQLVYTYEKLSNTSDYIALGRIDNAPSGKAWAIVDKIKWRYFDCSKHGDIAGKYRLLAVFIILSQITIRRTTWTTN